MHITNKWCIHTIEKCINEDPIQTLYKYYFKNVHRYCPNHRNYREVVHKSRCVSCWRNMSYYVYSSFETNCVHSFSVESIPGLMRKTEHLIQILCIIILKQLDHNTLYNPTKWSRIILKGRSILIINPYKILALFMYSEVFGSFLKKKKESA